MIMCFGFGQEQEDIFILLFCLFVRILHFTLLRPVLFLRWRDLCLGRAQDFGFLREDKTDNS